MHNDNDTLNITDANLLANTIEKVEARIKVREMELKSRFARLPQEGVKSAISMILPGFLTSKLAGASLSAVWSLARIVTGHKKAIFPLIGSAAKAGIFSFIKKRVQNFGHKREKAY
jgi:hypothetical protein